MAPFTPRTTEREMRSADALCMVGHKRERVLGRVGRAVNAAARDFAREAAQLENGGGREAPAERLVEQQVEVVDKLLKISLSKLLRLTKIASW